MKNIVYLSNEDDFLRVFLHNNFNLDEIFSIWSTFVTNDINL